MRAGAIDLQTALSYATNPGNLRLELADLSDKTAGPKTTARDRVRGTAEVEIEL